MASQSVVCLSYLGIFLSLAFWWNQAEPGLYNATSSCSNERLVRRMEQGNKATGLCQPLQPLPVHLQRAPRAWPRRETAYYVSLREMTVPFQDRLD